MGFTSKASKRELLLSKIGLIVALMFCATEAMLLTLWMRGWLCLLRLEGTNSLWATLWGIYWNVDCCDHIFVSTVLVCQKQKERFLFLRYWPESKSSHTGRHGRCPDGSEATAGFLRFGSGRRRFWTRLAGAPGKMTGGSGTPQSRSGSLTRPQTACSLAQRQMSWGVQSAEYSPRRSRFNAAASINIPH